MKKRLLANIILVLVAHFVFSQADINTSGNWYNKSNYNPANTAKPNYIYLYTDANKQWAGINGTPAYFNLQAYTYFNSINSAFGFLMTQDNTGLTYSINPMFSYAYRVNNNNRWSLSFGLALGAFIRNTDVPGYTPLDDNDPVLMNDVENTLKPDANTGIEFQSKYFLFGASATHLFSITSKENIYMNTFHKYVYAGYKNNDAEVIGYFLGAQLVNHNNVYVYEGNATLRFKYASGFRSDNHDLFDFGLTYRSSQHLTATLNFILSKHFRAGYAYGQSFMPGYYANPTHQIMLEYRIPYQQADCTECQEELESWYP